MKITGKKIFGGLGIAAAVYGSGLFAQIFFGNVNIYSKQAEKYLMGRKDAITRNIEDYNKGMSVAREPFFSQYKDSLENAVKDTTFLGKEIRIAEEEANKYLRKSLSSWAGFFID